MAVDVSENRQTERTPRKCFRCGSEDHIIAKCPKPIKDNEKRQKKVRLNEKGNCPCDNGENNSDKKIYAYMAHMSNNDECSSANYGDSSQLTHWILDSGATCHMKPEVSYLIPGSLEYTDKYIEVTDVHHVTEKQKGQVQIKMCDNTGKPFIVTLHNILLESDLCDRLFSSITLMNSGHTCIFYKGFCTVYFGAKENIAGPLPYSAQGKHALVGKIKEISNKNKSPARKKIALELLHHRLGHRSTR